MKAVNIWKILLLLYYIFALCMFTPELAPSPANASLYSPEEHPHHQKEDPADPLSTCSSIAAISTAVLPAHCHCSSVLQTCAAAITGILLPIHRGHYFYKYYKTFDDSLKNE